MDREVTTVINSLLANKKLADDLVDFLINENQRLREALQTIAEEGSGWGQSVALAALKDGRRKSFFSSLQKESE